MNEDSHNPSIDPPIEPELEARIIALVLGEASDFEEAELNRLIAEQPELAAFQREMQHLHGMLEEVGAGEANAPEDEWKLPADRRNKVLSVIQGEAGPEAERTVQPVIQRDDSTSQRVWFGLPRTVTATICSIAVCGFLVLQSVFWRNERAASVYFSGTAKEPEGVELVAGTVMTFERDYGSLAPETVPTGGPGKFTDTPTATELDTYGFLPLPKKEADHKVNSSSSLDAIRNTLASNSTVPAETYLDDDVQFFEAGPSFRLGDHIESWREKQPEIAEDKSEASRLPMTGPSMAAGSPSRYIRDINVDDGLRDSTIIADAEASSPTSKSERSVDNSWGLQTQIAPVTPRIQIEEEEPVALGVQPPVHVGGGSDVLLGGIKVPSSGEVSGQVADTDSKSSDGYVERRDFGVFSENGEASASGRELASLFGVPRNESKGPLDELLDQVADDDVPRRHDNGNSHRIAGSDLSRLQSEESSLRRNNEDRASGGAWESDSGQQVVNGGGTQDRRVIVLSDGDPGVISGGEPADVWFDANTDAASDQSGSDNDEDGKLGDVSVESMPDLGVAILNGNEADFARTESLIRQLERGKSLEELAEMARNGGSGGLGVGSATGGNGTASGGASETGATTGGNATGGQSKSQQDEGRPRGQQRGSGSGSGSGSGAGSGSRLAEKQQGREEFRMPIPELPTVTNETQYSVTVPQSERGEVRKSREIAKEQGRIQEIEDILLQSRGALAAAIESEEANLAEIKRLKDLLRLNEIEAPTVVAGKSEKSTDGLDDMIAGLTTHGRSTAREYWKKRSSGASEAEFDSGWDEQPASDSEDAVSDRFRTQTLDRKELADSRSSKSQTQIGKETGERLHWSFDSDGKSADQNARRDSLFGEKPEQQSDIVNVEEFEIESFANSVDNIELSLGRPENAKEALNAEERRKLKQQIAQIEKLKKNKADNSLPMLNGIDESFATWDADYAVPRRWSELLPKEKTADAESKFIESDRPTTFDVFNEALEKLLESDAPRTNNSALYSRTTRHSLVRPFDAPAVVQYPFYTTRGPKDFFGRKAMQRVAVPAGLNETPTTKDAFSTFSLHVSDVSFKLAQAALARGEWPDAKKIRIEEFVNAFNYGDPLPGTDEHVACRMEQSIHPFLQQRNVLRIAMRTGAAGRASNVPLRLTFLLDNSGSMERVDRQQTVRRAFAMLAQQLTPIDKVTVISFARQPRLLADRISGNEAAKLVQLIDKLPSEGGTNIESALQLAFEKAKEQQTSNAQNRIVLLTDGAVNLGDADPESLSRMVTAMRDSGIAFDAAGIVADGLNDEVLEALTRKGDGRYYLLDSPESAEDGFARQIAGALRPSAKNVKVQVEFNPKRVARFKLLGFEKHVLKKEDFHNDKVDAAEMAAEEAGVALYQFEAMPDGEGDIGSVSVRFRDLSSGQMVENRWPIPYEAGAPRPDLAAPSLRIAMSAAMLAAKLRGEPLGETVNLQTLSQLVSGLPDEERGAVRVQQLQRMIEQARQLSEK